MKSFLNKKLVTYFVKIIIGTSETGMRGIKAPTKTISLVDTDVEEVHKILIKFFEEVENGKRK